MDEFDLESNENIGTPVSKINLDYKSDMKYKEDKLSKKDLGMNQLARNLELKLDSRNTNIESEESEKKDNYLNKISNFKYYDLVFYIFFFILLNTEFIVGLIKKVPYNNLVIRTIIFSIMIYIVKKLN
jgi:hypothetical protein